MPISRSVEKIAITLGDPAGIGPEVTLKALDLWLTESRGAGAYCHTPLLLGKASFYRDLAEKLSLGLRFQDLDSPEDLCRGAARPAPATIPCYFPEPFPKKVVRGRSDKHLTKLAVSSIERAVGLAMKGQVDSIVTAPINKAGLKQAGYPIPGHTEFLARLSKTRRFEMMLVGGPLRVVPVTRHMALKHVSASITRRRVEEAILLTDLELRRSFGISRPRLVVCGLNPHAGEQGRFGTEEITRIAPAVQNARRKTNARITGPLSPDALFHDAYRGKYDAEICMYHDQGLIPLKMISRGGGVNATLGLPFVRTSPDHGTGYDIARRFCADPGSMLEALRLARQLSQNRKNYARRRN